MKLRNKGTGEIVVFGEGIVDLQKIGCKNVHEMIAAGWEDYEEPKSIKEIDVILDAIGEYCEFHSYYSKDLEKIKILNIAEEKLKAWKRLKEKGFRFERWGMGGEYGNTITFSDYIEYNDETRADLDLLFSGGEK